MGQCVTFAHGDLSVVWLYRKTVCNDRPLNILWSAVNPSVGYQNCNECNFRGSAQFNPARDGADVS